jgi:hypothetical protein
MTICCGSGIAIIRSNIPTESFLRWEHEPSGTSGMISMNIPNHPLTPELRANTEGYGYLVKIDWVSQFTGQRQVSVYPQNATKCKKIVSWYIRISNAADNYSFEGYTNSWQVPSGVNFGYAGGGSIRFTGFAEDGSVAFNLDATGNAATQYVKVLLTQERNFNDTNPSCSTSCELFVKDSNDNEVFSREFEDGCPQVNYIPCEYDPENTQERQVFLESYDTLDGSVLDTITRTIVKECLRKLLVDDEGRKGVEIIKERTTTVITYSNMVAGQIPTENTQQTEEERTLYEFWSPYGCDYPRVSISCVGSDEECPEGTAYRCTRSDGKTCCYDCEGNVIAVID